MLKLKKSRWRVAEDVVPHQSKYLLRRLQPEGSQSVRSFIVILSIALLSRAFDTHDYLASTGEHFDHLGR